MALTQDQRLELQLKLVTIYKEAVEDVIQARTLLPLVRDSGDVELVNFFTQVYANDWNRAVNAKGLLDRDPGYDPNAQMLVTPDPEYAHLFGKNIICNGYTCPIMPPDAKFPPAPTV